MPPSLQEGPTSRRQRQHVGQSPVRHGSQHHCLKMANDPQWKQVNSEFQQRYQAMEVY